jgi:hypothetical protein
MLHAMVKNKKKKETEQKEEAYILMEDATLPKEVNIYALPFS